MAQTVCIFGAAIGALSCSWFLSMGKFKLIFILNGVLIVGVGISLIGQALWIICIGRLLWGVSFGAFSVACAKYVNEITPVELIGVYGAMLQLTLCFGAALPGTLALAYPVPFDAGHVSKDDFYVQNYWRIIWSLPLVTAFFQILLLLTCFRHETPQYYLEKGQEDELLKVMKKFYKGTEIRRRIDELKAESNKEGS